MVYRLYLSNLRNHGIIVAMMLFCHQEKETASSQDQTSDIFFPSPPVAAVGRLLYLPGGGCGMGWDGPCTQIKESIDGRIRETHSKI